jgi:tRNA G10  N-methylase Trm11
VNPYYQKDGVTIFHAPMADVPFRMGFADAVITDPPYPREYTAVWNQLGTLSSWVLKRGGSLLSIIPHYLLPDVLEEMRQHEPLKYRWICAMWQHEGSHPRMSAIGVQVVWKPIVWWVQGARPWGGSTPDGFENHPQANGRKKLHKWEQGMDWAHYCLKFVPPGGTVVDPMMGSGTLVVAARDQGFTVVGVDNDEAACETTVRRLEGSVS